LVMTRVIGSNKKIIIIEHHVKKIRTIIHNLKKKIRLQIFASSAWHVNSKWKSLKSSQCTFVYVWSTFLSLSPKSSVRAYFLQNYANLANWLRINDAQLPNLLQDLP